jgi:DNA-damage-inducible protein D
MMTTTETLFEGLAKQNGQLFWWAREFMVVLGYDSWDAFDALVRKTKTSYLSVTWINAEQEFRYTEAEGEVDYKLSRWACYILAMNADTTHPEVIKAQSFFANAVEAFQASLSPEEIERFGIRSQLKESFKDLNSAFAKGKGTDYAKFNQAGIIGMYNQPNWQLAKQRGTDTGKLYDTMGRTELAANLFRVTQTEAKIKAHQISGQKPLEEAHTQVGREVRDMVFKNVGRYPEQLEQTPKPVPKIEKDLKKTHKALKDK